MLEKEKKGGTSVAAQMMGGIREALLKMRRVP